MKALTPSPGKPVQVPSKSDARLIKFLSRPLFAEEQNASGTVKSMPWIIAGVILGFLGLAGFAEVSESSTVQGQIAPAGAVKVVQHLEGGIIAEINVDDGDLVAAGQSLIRLESATSAPELHEMRARAASLALNKERLRAFVLEREPAFENVQQYPELVKDQRDTLNAQRRDRENHRAVLQSRIRQQQAQIITLTKQRDHQQELRKIARQVVDMRSNLLSKGLTSRIAYLEAMRQYSQTNVQLAENLGQINKAQEDLAEAENALLELDSKLRKEAQTELGRISGELAQVTEALERHQDRVTRLVIRSPTEGIVTGLAKQTIGAIVRPGETLMEIVPLSKELVAEVRLLPRDIGHIKVGDKARVVLSTYDASIFGTVDGRLQRISASTFADDNGGIYYKGTIALGRTHVGNEPGHYPILPGMEVTGDIVTGSRTLLRYLLKPIYRAFDGAFHER